MSEAERLVLDFHRKYGLAINDTSRTLNGLRADLIREEATEAAAAIEADDRPAMAKELGDLIVVAYGAAITHGLNLDLAVVLVHESNMTKTPGNFREDGKLHKGPDYRPPDMTPALEAPGYWRAVRNRCRCLRAPAGIKVVSLDCPEHGRDGRWPL